MEGTGCERKGKVLLHNQAGYLGLGLYSLWLLLLGFATLGPGSSQQWKWVGMGQRVCPWISLPEVSLLKASSLNDWFL